MDTAWAFIGDETDLGDATAISVDVAGEPAIYTGDHLLSNACTHRGALLLDGACRGRSIVCPYHGRRFGLDGAVADAPGFDPVPRDEPLPRLALERLGPMAFGAVRPAASLSAILSEARARVGFFEYEGLTPDPASARAYEVEAPWTLWCENYLEGFHIPFVHPRLARALDLSRYEHEVHTRCALQVGEAASGEPAFEVPEGHVDAGRRVGGYYLFVFPFTALNLYPWGLSLNAIEPLGPRRTRVRYRAYVRDASLRERGAGAGLDEVERQDDDIVERCARGMAGALARPGRLHPVHEQAVAWFRRAVRGVAGRPRAASRP